MSFEPGPPGKGGPRPLWFQEDPDRRESIADAYDEIPLSRLLLPRLEALALSRAYGLYESVGDLLRADPKIRHIRNLGRLGLERLDDALQPILAQGVVTPEQAHELVARVAQRLPGIDALEAQDYERLPWYDIDPEDRARVALRFATMPVDAWGLSNRARNALRVAGMRFVAEVLTAAPEVQRSRGIGFKTLCELHARCTSTLRAEDDAAERWLRERSG